MQTRDKFGPRNKFCTKEIRTTTMLQSLVKGGFWSLFLAITLATLLTAGVKWMFDHPYAVHWDEAEYFNTGPADLRCLQEGGLRALRGEILYHDRIRPPAYRLLSLPFFCVTGFSPLTARLVSLGFHVLALGFVYLTMRKVASPQYAALTTLLVCLCPEVVATSITFGTEYSLLLATSAMMFFVISSFDGRSGQWWCWIGLGLSIGLGLLSKSSFVAFAGPVLAFLLVARFSKTLSAPSPWFAIKAGVLGALIAAPWWWVNAQPALAYSQYSRDFIRHSLGSPSVGTLGSWLLSVFQCLAGYGSIVVILLIGLAWLRKWIVQRNLHLDSIQRTTFLVCAVAALPLILLQLLGTNHLLRHLSPTVIPIAIAIGLLAQVTGCLDSRLFALSAAVAFSAQLVMIVVPAFHPNTSETSSQTFANGIPPGGVMARIDQWNWRPLRDISCEHDYKEPAVSFLGGGRNLNPPQIRYPWSVDGAPAPQVKWLWRYEQGPIDWQKVMELTDRSDIVVTAPGYVGDALDKEDLDNQHNAELALKLSQDSRFEGPIRLWMGRFEPVEVDVFIKAR